MSIRFPSAPDDGGSPATPSAIASTLALIGWLLVTFCAPAMGLFGIPDAWYADLNKPWWNPPGWIFGPVWTVLYLLMAVAAWLVWRQGGWAARRGPLVAYLVQLVLNAAWSPLFFGLHLPGVALANISVLLVAIVITLIAFGRVSRTAAILLVPYLLWVNFATILNLTLWLLNR